MQPYHTLSQIITFNNDDEKAWWDKAAPMLLKSMQNAGYDVDAQYHQLGLLYKCTIPYLGMFPTVENDHKRWKSFLCPYGIPFEPSLNLSQGTVRFAFEPVGRDAGTEKDPQNMNSLWECLEGLTQYSGQIDTTWYHRFASRLLLNEEESQRLADTKKYTFTPGHGVYGFAIDLKGAQPMVKGYFWVTLKSRMSGLSTGQLMFDAVRDVDTEGTVAEPLAMLEKYSHENKKLQLGFISFDMIQPQDARIKVYGLDQEVSFEHVQSLWTMGGRIQSESSQEGLKLLQKLWDLMQIPPGVRTGDVEHLALGELPKYKLPTMVNWTLLPGHSDPLPQVYLVPFGMQDLHIADALTAFFEYLGWTDLARDYKKQLTSYL